MNSEYINKHVHVCENHFGFIKKKFNSNSMNKKLSISVKL